LIRLTLPPLPGSTKPRYWAIQLIPAELVDFGFGNADFGSQTPRRATPKSEIQNPKSSALIQLVEVSSLVTGKWSMEFVGPTLHVQKQIGFLTTATNGRCFRFGGFTQHGQLFDLKDWFFVQRNNRCAGLIALRPGSWTHPAVTLGHAQGEGESLQVEFPHGSPRTPRGLRTSRVRRSFLLTCGPAEEMLSYRQTGQTDFEPHHGYAHWPAHQAARFGFARPQRLDSYARIVRSMKWSRPVHFAFGDAEALSRAVQRAQGESNLAANPFWAGDYAAAKTWMFQTLRLFDAALRDGAYLHPLGTPVAARVLGPAVGLFHLLDFQGQLSDAERADAAELIATLAELLHRRDFYPHDYAMTPPEFPYTEASVYRGMLNQNFNTDRYVFVGLAGCVLPTHPHAGRWRRHAIEQFDSQMRCFVHPGGCWEESHTYANHVKMTLLPLVVALRHVQGDSIDLLANENFLATCRFFIPLLSPRDALVQNHRRVPAIGDHHLGKHEDFACIFGWLATLCPEHRDEFLWAWREQGSPVGERASMQSTTFSPLILPARDVATPPAPALPMIRSLPGYGAFARRAFNTKDESLLVVRCGSAWGHYHNDQGSFWWWRHNRLICCDAGLGEGALKFAHHGHNVPGYVGHEPRQWLDHQPHEIEQCEQANGAVTIRCRIPTMRWMHAGQLEDPIAASQRPLVIRTFEWSGDDDLRITDQFTRSPNGLTTFTLHVACQEVHRIGPTEIEFHLNPGTLRLKLPIEPKQVQFHRTDYTAGITCTYAEGTWTHALHVS
jgi:hypothetical protein